MTSLAGLSIAPHLKVLRRAGFCGLTPPRPGAPGRGPRVRFIHWAYCWISLFLTTFYLFQHLVCAYQVRHDTARISRVLYAMFSFCTCVSKQFTFQLRQGAVDVLIACLDDPLFNQNGEGHAKMLRQTAKRAHYVMRVFYSCGMSTITLWLTFPVVQRLQGKYVELAFWTFIDYTDSKMFALVVAHSAWMTVLLAMGNTTMDSFIGALLYQCGTQLRILRMNFETLPTRAKKLSQETDEKYETLLNKLLVECILHSHKISVMTEQILDVFGWSVLVQFGVGGWMMCTAAYTLISVDLKSIEFMSSSFFILCILIELYIYCYFGNEVTIESERVVESIYCMQWVDTPLRFQKALVLVLERAKRPLRPTAVGLIPLSVDTYVKILKSTYSLFSVLRQTK